MCLRISRSTVLPLAVLLAACGSDSDAPPSPTASASASPAGAVMTCAIGAGAALGPGCFVERIAGTSEIILYHPDGGFRRLTRDPATGALATRDGAEAVVLEQGGQDAVQFSIAGDRYRIPLALLNPAS